MRIQKDETQQIASLVEKLFSTNQEKKRFQKNQKLRDKLFKEHHYKDIAEAMINKLHILHKNRQLKEYIIKNDHYGNPVYFAIDTLNEIFSRISVPDEFIHRTAVILEWDEIHLLSQSERDLFVTLLAKKRRKEEFKYFLTFAEKVRGVEQKEAVLILFELAPEKTLRKMIKTTIATCKGKNK